MPLSPAEEQELQQLRQEQATLRQSLPTASAPPAQGGLSPAEARELAQLRQEQQQLRGQLATAPPVAQSRAKAPPRAASPYLPLAYSAADEAGVPRDLFAGMIEQESGWNPRAVSPKGAQGLGQFMPPTAKGMGLTDPFDPEQNLRAAARYLKQHLQTFGGDETKALAAYNAGPAAVRKYGGVPPFAETQKYVRRVQDRRRGYAGAAPAAEPVQITERAPSARALAPAPAAAPAKPKPTPLPKAAPTISFKASPAERAVAEAEAAWNARPAFAKAKGYRPADVGPIRDLTDRRVAAVRVVLKDATWRELAQREAKLRAQLAEIERRAAGTLSPAAADKLRRDLGQWQANAAAVDQRKEQLRHYVRLGEQLGAVESAPPRTLAELHATEGQPKKPLYQLPQGKYRQEETAETPGFLAALTDQTMLGPVAGAGKTAAQFLSAAIAGGEEAKQHRAREYERPELVLPRLTGKTPEERRAQIDEKNRLQQVIQRLQGSTAGLPATKTRQQMLGGVGEPVAGRDPATFRRAVEDSYRAAHGKPLSLWQRKLYPTLLRIADVEQEAARKPVAGAGVDIAMLLAGGPLARAGAGVVERAIARKMTSGILPPTTAAALRVSRVVLPKVAAGVAAGGGAGAPIAAVQATAQGKPAPEVLKETARGFAVGSAIGVFAELGLGALAAGLGRAGERLDATTLRQRAAKSAKATAQEYGLTSAEVPALRDRIVEALTAPTERQGGLIHQLAEDLQTRTPENPLVPPSRLVRGRSTPAEKAPVPSEQATVKATAAPDESRATLLQQIQEAKTELDRLGSFHPFEDPSVSNRRVALREQIADIEKRLPPEKAVPTTHRTISGEQGAPSINDVPGTEVTGRTHPGEVLTLVGLSDKPDPITGELMVTLRRQDGSITETTPSGYTRGYVKVEETPTTRGPVGQFEATGHPVEALQRATPEEVAQRGALAEDPAERARLQDWAERQQRRANQYDFAQRPLPIDAAEEYANAWASLKNPAYRDYQNLRSAGRRLAGEDPELAQRLVAAADQTRQDWIYAFRDQHFRQQGFAEEFLAGVPREVPTDRSPWRALTSEERARLNPAERDALLRQDVTHSLQTLDPDHVPRTEVPKVAKKNLENYADQLHQQAQQRLVQLSDEAAARGPAAEAPPPAAEAAPPVAEVPPAVPAAEPAVGPEPVEVASSVAETPPALPPVEERPALPPATEKPRVSPPVEQKPVEQVAAPLPPAKQEIVQEQAARVEREYRQQGYRPEAAKGEAEAVAAKARAKTPKARAIKGDVKPPETAASGGGGGVDVPPPAGQGPAAELPKRPKGMRPGFILAAPKSRGGFPEHGAGPKEWQFTGEHETYFRENFRRVEADWLDELRDLKHHFDTRGRDLRAWGRAVNTAVSLPKTPFYANVRQKLIRLVGGLERASDEAMGRMFEAYGRLKAPETILVNRVAFIRDMWEDVQTQLAEGVTPDGVKLPEPWTIQSAHNEWVRLNNAAAESPNVTAALEARRAMWDQAVNDYSNAYEAVTGRRPNLSRRDYFRHEVFLYQLGKAGLKGPIAERALPMPRRPSFTKPRRGTVLPYQTNLVDADHGVLAQMLYHTNVFKAWKEVMAFDIRHELEKQAAAWRVGHTTLDDPAQLTSLQELAKVVDTLPDTADGKYADFLTDLGRWRADPTSADAADLGRRALHYVKWLRARAEGVPTELAGKLPLRGVTEREAFQRNLRGDPTVTYRDLLPNGYREITRVGNVLERAWATHDVVDEMLDLSQRGFFGGALPPAAGEGRAALPPSTAPRLGPKPTGVLPGEVRMGVPHRAAPRFDSIIVPERLAEVVEGMQRAPLTGYNALWHTAKTRFMSGWKQQALGAPFRIVGYNLRNLTGDAEAMFVGNPHAFKKVPQATRELRNFLLRGESPSEELKEWMRRGGLSGVLASAEDVGSRNALDRFAKQLDQGRQIFPVEVWKGYWKNARIANDFREGILRYADYLDSVEHLQKHGRVRNFGASVPEELLALHDVRDQAYKHSNDLLGAFDEVSRGGQWVRQNLIPFWSWKEVNAKRWYQLGKNAWDDPHAAQLVGRRLLGYGGSRAIAFGSFALKAVAISTLLDTYNRLTDLEGELSLPPEVRSRPHILLGRGPDGQVQYIGRLGAVSDFLGWFGVHNPHGFAYEFLNGRTLQELAGEVRAGKKTPRRAAADFLLGPRASLPNAVVEALRGSAKDVVGGMFGAEITALEQITGKKIDLKELSQRPIADRGQYLFDSLGVGPLYRGLYLSLKPPQRPGGLQRALGVSSVAYHEGAYTETRSWVRDYLRRVADDSAQREAVEDPKVAALYQVGQAKRFGDVVAVDANLLDYVANGGTQKEFVSKVMKLSPLGGVPVKTKGGYRLSFLGRLTDQEWEQVQRGYDNWARTWAPGARLDARVEKGATPEETATNRYLWSINAEATVRGQVASDLTVLTGQMQYLKQTTQQKVSKKVGERAGYVPGLTSEELVK